METTNLDQLNDQYAIGEHVRFIAGPEGLPMAELRGQHSSALVAVQGGHVARFQPHNAQPLLWVSRLSSYAAGKSIRGGIPVCWPWFAQHPTDAQLPFHGFVRARIWQVRAAAALPDGAVQLRLGIASSQATLAIWPHEFDLELVVTAGRALHTELVARNTGALPCVVGGALHSYFQVGDITQIAIHGLEGCAYVDKVDSGARKVQAGPVTISGETDRIYLDTAATCEIDDPALGRRIRIGKSGSNTTVVWNPWIEKAKAMADCGDDEYQHFVCVETANAGADVYELAPGAEHRMSVTFAL